MVKFIRVNKICVSECGANGCYYTTRKSSCKSNYQKKFAGNDVAFEGVVLEVL